MSDELIFDVDLDGFDSNVLAASAKQPVLVDFWAEWCSPCIYLDPVLKEVVSRYAGAVRLAKVEVDEGDNMKLAGRYQVRGFPTVILFVDGKEVDRFSSVRPAGFIRQFIDVPLSEDRLKSA
jgi:putative thioredoxin